MRTIKTRIRFWWFALFVVVGCISVYIYMNSTMAAPTAQQQPKEKSVEVRSPILWIGPEDRAAVAVTFDDGPHAMYTPQVLDVLAKYNAKATFFCLGEQAERNKEIVARAVREGHEIANHTMTHPQAPKVSAEQLQQEVGENNKLLEEITGQKVQFFRPPYGYFNADYFKACQERNLTVVLWTIVPKDWEQPPAEVIAQRVISEIQPGSIVLLHDGGGSRTQTVKALEIILQELDKRNLKAVTLSQLLK